MAVLSVTEAQQAQALEALGRATGRESTMNYQAIFDGFAAMGIDPATVSPRENVFTFHAWLALGRCVAKGQHGVKVVTFVVGKRKDKNTGAEVPFRMARTTTVFHVSQTIEIGQDAPTVAQPAEQMAQEGAEVAA